MLPAPLSGLETLAHNLWWSWDSEATALWESVDPWRWETSRQNPIAMLQDVDPERWAQLADDPAFVARVEKVLAKLQTYLASSRWCEEASPEVFRGGVCYLSMEFGLHESIRIYSGGLGVLAGDHLKSASDLGVPLIAIGLMYRKGYFRQLIDDGQQIAAFPDSDYDRVPAKLIRDPSGHPVLVDVPISHHTVQAQIWRIDVGRTRLLLLDTDHEFNNERDRFLTQQLYGGDHETRIRQEMILGVGGIRALRAIGENPALYHMNEGHCAFAALELIRERRERGSSWDEAVHWARRHCVFTTHTPVPAGHDRFPWDIVDRVLGPWRKSQDLPPGSYMDIGRVRPGDWNEPLCMTVLALRTSGRANGVSKLHGEISRDMWQPMFHVPVEQVPIGHVTNGVHPLFWMAPEARALFDEHVPGWRDAAWDEHLWEAVEQIPAPALWELRSRLRRKLVDTVARRAGRHLDPDALTIGFARRFAPYKRGDLLFRDPDRLEALLDKGVQVVFSGKAHPADQEGRKLVAEVVKWTRHRRFRDRVVFVEDYDMAVGRALTSGADVWLNNPRRPQEASGTSGQKVLLNGGLNLSILDGWWAEAYDGTNGWAIGGLDIVGDLPTQDNSDAMSLYTVLERQVLPAWRERDAEGLPPAWIERMRRSIETGIPRFNTHRMVRDYVLEMYAPLVREQQ